MTDMEAIAEGRRGPAGPLVIPVAGLQFHRLADAADGLMQGLPLRLERDPGNPHDSHAIRVLITLADLDAAEIEPPPALQSDRARARWMLGHIPAQTTQTDWARLLADEMDAAGISSDAPGLIQAYFDHGRRVGAFSVFIRLEGHLADAALWRAGIEQEARRQAALDRQVESAIRDVQGKRSTAISGSPMAAGPAGGPAEWEDFQEIPL